MAEVSCNYMDKISVMSKSQLRKPIVFVVDMINGFAKEGALADKRIMKIVPAIKMLVEDVRPSVFICDSHDLDAREFNAFPVHCIKNTVESQVVDELKPYVKRMVLKNSTNAFFAPEMQKIITEELDEYNDIIILGCCSDICVMQFALSLNTYLNENEKKQHRIIVPINMIETYNIDGVHNNMKWNEVACDIMMANAVEVVELK